MVDSEEAVFVQISAWKWSYRFIYTSSLIAILTTLHILRWFHYYFSKKLQSTETVTSTQVSTLDKQVLFKEILHTTVFCGSVKIFRNLMSVIFPIFLLDELTPVKLNLSSLDMTVAELVIDNKGSYTQLSQCPKHSHTGSESSVCICKCIWRKPGKNLNCVKGFSLRMVPMFHECF